MLVNFKNSKFFPHIEFFWSLDSVNFAKLPTLTPEENQKLSKIQDLFLGQHDKSLFPEQEIPKEGNKIENFKI